MVIKLIAKDKNEHFQFEGRCKLIIDDLSKLLIIQPLIEEFKMISALFTWKFVAQENILFIFAEHDFQDFALIFENSFKCNKIYKILLEKKATSDSNELIYKRFLPPLFKDIVENIQSPLILKEIVLKWMKKLVGNEKDEGIRILKENNVEDFFDAFAEENFGSNHRKRKAKHINRQENVADTTSFPKDLIIKAPNFHILKFVKNGVPKMKLLLFTIKNGKKYCYEYFGQHKIFKCFECMKRKKYLAAKIIKQNGKDVIKLNSNEHICEMKEYGGIIEKPDFEIFSYEQGQRNPKRITIFLDSSRTSCYEYSRLCSKFLTYFCLGCHTKKQHTSVNLYQRENGTEFLLLNSRTHICSARTFNPEKYAEKEIVEAENFKFFKIENDKFKLVIFASSDKTTCYEYSWTKDKKYRCNGCNLKSKKNIAEVLQNSEGIDYLKLGRKKHACTPREYNPEKFKVSPNAKKRNFKIFEIKPVSKLIEFCKTNNKLCYEYYWKNDDRYLCCHCPVEKNITATVCKNDDERKYLKVSGKHVCNLRKFDEKKFKEDIIVNKPMYTIYSTIGQRGNISKAIAIFPTNEKNLCYKYYLSGKNYACKNCQTLNEKNTLFVKNVGNEDQCILISNQKHFCEPVESNFIFAPNYCLLKRKVTGRIVHRMVIFTNAEKTECYEYTIHGITLYFCYACKKQHNIYVYAYLVKNDETEEEFVEMKKTQHKCKPIKFIPEIKNIVKFPGFKLWEENFRNEKLQKLTIYDPKNKNFGYIFDYRKDKKDYVCVKCQHKKKNVTAKVLQDKDGKNYVYLNTADHFCKLQKV